MQTNSITLVTDQGDEIEIRYPDSIMDEFLEELNQCREKNSYWNVGNWAHVTCSFKGVSLNEVNMFRIIGIS